MRIYLDKRKLSKSPTPTEHQHYRRFMILYLFIVLDHQYGRQEVLWEHFIKHWTTHFQNKAQKYQLSMWIRSIFKKYL